MYFKKSTPWRCSLRTAEPHLEGVRSRKVAGGAGGSWAGRLVRVPRRYPVRTRDPAWGGPRVPAGAEAQEGLPGHGCRLRVAVPGVSARCSCFSLTKESTRLSAATQVGSVAQRLLCLEPHSETSPGSLLFSPVAGLHPLWPDVFHIRLEHKNTIR